MFFWRLRPEVFLLVASSTIAIVVFILACCHRVEKKWIEEYAKNNPKSGITEDSETGSSVQIQVCQDAICKGHINQGFTVYVVDNIVENNGKTISSGENDQVLNQTYNNDEDVKGLTRLNHDGSMDTQF